MDQRKIQEVHAFIRKQLLLQKIGDPPQDKVHTRDRNTIAQRFISG